MVTSSSLGSHGHHELPKSETHGALMTGRAVIRKEDLEAGSLWNWEMQPSVTLKAFRSLRRMRVWIRCYWNPMLLQEESCQFLENLWGLLKSDRGSGEKEGKRRRRKRMGNERGKERKTGRRKSCQ